MSNKSRRRNNKSQRRLSMAAGALLAGAAIPLAAAGTAWADDTPIVPVAPTGPAGTSGSSPALAAAPGSVNYAVSINGTDVVELGSAQADSGTAGTHNVAIANGVNADATVAADGSSHDTARATG